MAPVRRLTHGALIAVIALTPVTSHAQSAVMQPRAASSPLDGWQGLIAEASRRFGLPEAWIYAVMRAESGGQTMLDGRPITSHAGAMGLMQIMPETWAELRAHYGLGNDPYDPHDNILAGTAYLRELYLRYGYPSLFAAYNAGPARFDGYLVNRQPLPDETLAYLAVLGQPTFGAPGPPAVPSGTSLFFSLRGIATIASRPPMTSSPGGLFIPLTTIPERKP